MRSRLAARSTRLVLAAAAVTALAATTACEPEDSTDTGGSAAPSEAASDDGGSATPSSDSPSTGASSPAGGDKSGYGQSCGTNDLDLTVAWKSDPDVDGYYLVTAKAKSGITCYLDVNTPSVSFGSGADGVASPVGQGGEDPIKLTGSAVAYTGIDAKTTGGDAGTQFENVIVAVTEDDPDPAELELPDTATVDKPVVTNWSTRRNETVPRII
ncbi:hypothetical protein C6Y14_00500 [Streptomyces dioscori]|uniref:DUF4232 domain-containing protein n=1 Tax=Streptomyces dioscori TaxID=2109333 RepID=A0A2P8QGH0_9ACTN|nr:hypothetical protein [Streptomyces dioscori]PSM45344.1 hypothetical protein C6Y14_00500 [Streptomyces dioscori]